MSKRRLASISFLGFGSVLLFAAVPPSWADQTFASSTPVYCQYARCSVMNPTYPCTYCSIMRSANFGQNPSKVGGTDGYWNEDVGPCGKLFQGSCSSNGPAACTNSRPIRDQNGVQYTCSDLVGIVTQKSAVSPSP